MKVIQFVPEYPTAPDMSAKIRSMLYASPEMRKFVNDYMKARAEAVSADVSGLETVRTVDASWSPTRIDAPKATRASSQDYGL